ncbi:MAG: hypothetical protein HZA32_02410 [Opitutae bacterium]|nr:hypothetical protein [Opitutae bacterium]
MNLFLHQIRHEVRQLGWGLVVWAFAGGCLIFAGRPSPRDQGVGALFVYAVGSLLVILLSGVLAAKAMQQDHPTESNVFWRTRPVSPGRLLTVKLSLIGFTFVLVPAAVSLFLFRGAAPMNFETVNSTLFLWLTIAAMSAAIGACTKDQGRFVIVAIACLFAYVILKNGVSFFSGGGNTQLGMNFKPARGVASDVFCVALAALVIANQYFRRQERLSRVLLGVGVAGAALIANWQSS